MLTFASKIEIPSKIVPVKTKLTFCGTTGFDKGEIGRPKESDWDDIQPDFVGVEPIGHGIHDANPSRL